MKKRNKFLIKLGILCTAFVGLITALVVPTYAYTLSNDFVYSNNGLNIQSPSYCTFDTNNLTDSSILIVPTIDSGNTARPFICDLYDGSNSEVLYTTTLADSQNWQFETINLINGTDLDYLRSNWSNKTIRFIRDGFTRYDYVEYKISDVIDYYSQFIPINKIYTYFGVCFKVGWINVAVPGSINLVYVGFYFSDVLPTESTYEFYGVYGNFDDSYINTYSYNQGVLSQQSTITDLQEQIDNMDRQIANLSSQLSLAQSTQMRTLLWTIGSTPFESFKSIWDVNVWGVNIGGIIIGGFMALLIIYLIKKVWK